MSLERRARFFRQLAVMTRTGMPIANALRLAGDTAGGRYRSESRLWADGCTRGLNLADQLAAAREAPLPVALVRAGETTGRLPDLCGRIADHDEQMQALRSLAIGRLIYPAVLLHAALVVPVIPGVVLGDRSAAWLLVGPVVLWLVIGGLALLGRAGHRRGILARLALLPVIRLLSLPFLTGNVCLVLGCGVAAGLKHRDSLELAADACGNRLLGERLRTAAAGIDRGTIPDLTTGLREAGLAELTTSLIATGEHSGTLEKTIDQAAVAARESFQTRSTWATKIVTSGIYAAVTLFVAWKIVSMYAGILGAAGGDPYS